MDAPRTLRISAALGVLAYVVVRVIAPENGQDPISRAVMLAALVVVPLALALLPPVGARGAPWLALVAIAQPVCALAATVSLSIAQGPIAGALASVWMSFALLVALLGAQRIRALRTTDRRMVAIGLAAGLLMLPVGAAWLVASRMGLRPMGFDAVTVLLTAVHFHYAALGMPILIARSLERVPSRALAIALAMLVAGIPTVAVGITLHPAIALAGTLLVALGLLTHSTLGLARVLRTVRGRAAKIVLAISYLSPFLSMPLAAAWSIAQLAPDLAIGLDLDWMLRLHGQANAHGVVTMGLLAWTLEARQSQGTSTSAR